MTISSWQILLRVPKTAVRVVKIYHLSLTIPIRFLSCSRGLNSCARALARNGIRSEVPVSNGVTGGMVYFLSVVKLQREFRLEFAPRE